MNQPSMKWVQRLQERNIVRWFWPPNDEPRTPGWEVVTYRAKPVRCLISNENGREIYATLMKKSRVQDRLDFAKLMAETEGA